MTPAKHVKRPWSGNRTFVALAAVLGVGLMALPAKAAGRPVTVVELFTSQGCSSVPPANRNVMTLMKAPDVLPLSFSVTYWDVRVLHSAGYIWFPTAPSWG